MKYIKEKLSSEKFIDRIIFISIIFFIMFFGITIISYYILPEGILKSKNPLSDWNNSSNIFIIYFQ